MNLGMRHGLRLNKQSLHKCEPVAEDSTLPCNEAAGLQSKVGNNNTDHHRTHFHRGCWERLQLQGWMEPDEESYILTRTNNTWLCVIIQDIRSEVTIMCVINRVGNHHIDELDLRLSCADMCTATCGLTWRDTFDLLRSEPAWPLNVSLSTGAKAAELLRAARNVPRGATRRGTRGGVQRINV